MKIVIALLSVIGATVIIVHQLRLNDAFTRSLGTSVDMERIVEIAPGDTLQIIMPVTNTSWSPVRILGSAATCRISEVRVPDILVRKRDYIVTATLIAPEEEGDYSEALVLRTNAEAVFYGADLRYQVRRGAALRDTLWLGRSAGAVYEKATGPGFKAHQ
jgi:hypothetical protein